MIRVILFLVVLLSLPLQGCYSQNQEEMKGEAEMADPYTWDFGRVKEGEIFTHVFILKNESEKTLTIREVNTSCGCTASKVKKDILSPGESTQIEVKFNSKGYFSPVQQYIYVHTDSPDNPIIRFIIKADVIKS